MERPHWEYYLAVVQDLETVARYVEITQLNVATHSVEFVRILLSLVAPRLMLAPRFCASRAGSGLSKVFPMTRNSLQCREAPLPAQQSRRERRCMVRGRGIHRGSCVPLGLLTCSRIRNEDAAGLLFLGSSCGGLNYNVRRKL